MSIEVAHLSKLYGGQKAVNDITFSIGEGEIVGFLGPNGAGKSTTMKMITGYLQPDGGTVKICGKDVQQHPLQIKRDIGYLPEANPLYFDMYVKEYLEYVAGIHQVENKTARIAHMIELTGLTLEQKKKIGQLSKGYKQRVGLAASLIHAPRVLILDEPTSGLDPNQIVEIRNVIKAQGADKTVLFSSHILQEVQAICSRVIIINRGNVVADDSLQQLQSNSGKGVVVVFEEILEREWLMRLPAIQQIHTHDNQRFQLDTTNVNEARKQLLELAIRENLNIVTLQTEGSNLEEIFRSLTQNPEPAPQIK
ncbi:gliding motility-associated ABC transporter ATP-binding subunit GldA [Deminuibacter soli]|uniref:Gliding motility-associated ABC transporter ATP-binding subunit GldA n=1 Tax=Deminuibacter soli TaxID=2291815 RepID=A0A3E1NPS4_9BACT|nr:gliding motility-associated ABC transporter ATP-binding subunit GldA [Deminuibacter soli]RFM29931.1 gliding motility-associated ABC transporter ATP-binding subunit GldA [Deminuibacter soli]